VAPHRMPDGTAAVLSLGGECPPIDGAGSLAASLLSSELEKLARIALGKAIHGPEQGGGRPAGFGRPEMRAGRRRG
jgi:hypothetical protein